MTTRILKIICPHCDYRIDHITLKERLYNQVQKSETCWEWIGTVDSSGYGRIGVGKNNARFVHRVAWELTYGPISEGLFICHHCDNRRCIRLDHLFLGTVVENVADMVSKGRNVWGEDVGNSKLTEAQVLDILADLKVGDLTQQGIAKKYMVHPRTIQDIHLGKSWKHVPR